MNSYPKTPPARKFADGDFCSLFTGELEFDVATSRALRFHRKAKVQDSVIIRSAVYHHNAPVIIESFDVKYYTGWIYRYMGSPEAVIEQMLVALPDAIDFEHEAQIILQDG